MRRVYFTLKVQPTAAFILTVVPHHLPLPGIRAWWWSAVQREQPPARRPQPAVLVGWS